MKKVVNAVYITSSILASTSGKAEVKVIYGKDHRKEVSHASAFVQELARSTATLIPVKELTPDPDNAASYKLSQTTLKQWLENSSSSKSVRKLFSDDIVAATKEGITFCTTERFVNQPNPGMCSGFLIAPDLIVTAGHCKELENFCSDYKWVFDFKTDKDTGRAPTDVGQDNVYGCKRVVSGALSTVLNLDYAIVQLDRFVKGRRPLKISTDKTIADQTPLVMIGSPSGLPLKVASGAAVRTNVHPFFFSANLDSYQGNSGSAVFNSKTWVVEGILVRGETDFVKNPVLMCVQSNMCKDSKCRGEDVSRMTSIPEVAVMKTLNDAAFTGDVETLKSVLKLNTWVDFYDSNRQSPLMKAARGARTEALKLLLAKGADLNLIDVDGNTVLHHLVLTLNDKSADALDVLVAAKIDLEKKNFAGETALRVAGRLKNSAAARLLIKAGADKNSVDKKGETILFDFARAGKQEEISELLDLGVNPEIKNFKGFNAFGG